MTESDTMRTEEGDINIDHVAISIEVETLQEGDSHVDPCLDISQENGQTNCSNGAVNNVQEPEDLEEVQKADSKCVQLAPVALDELPANADISIEKSESSEDDVPLSQLKPEIPRMVHEPNPYSHIRSRPALRRNSPYQVRSEPVSPSGFAFPQLRKVDGQMSLLQGSDRKRPREDDSAVSSSAKRPCQGWNLTRWWKASEEDNAVEPPKRSCALM